eukprot:CAMPEP_0206464242 /NCGR_PEP_ID=MMETSP0324_2-20121206/27096_1 /ASSEMBLY_ACC=CAM_ASM_000836 /TAXON_ID=2866 /ORGANISM="Crypthecodinium cohnii, Strain Seligo" /LENGTH=46 /DNA_ID= /DNA_START= /DNA_END= /DNA_ORIENTATION=
MTELQGCNAKNGQHTAEETQGRAHIFEHDLKNCQSRAINILSPARL